MLKRDEKEVPEKKEQMTYFRTFFRDLITNFLILIEAQDYTQPEIGRHFLLYSERILELMVDLQALLPTRRYINVLIDDLHLIVRCQLCPILEHGDGHLFSQVRHKPK
jgi:intron-binding protein aquarius